MCSMLGSCNTMTHLTELLHYFKCKVAISCTIIITLDPHSAYSVEIYDQTVASHVAKT